MTENKSENQLINIIVESIDSKKGNNIICLDLREIEHAVCDYFIICDADSSTHTSAIAKGVEDSVKKEMNLNVWKRSGYENAQWILLDYGDVVVHAFQKTYREFYHLEDLWADAKITHFDTNS